MSEDVYEKCSPNPAAALHDEITELQLALVEMTAARDEAVAIAESAATWLEANTDKSARRGVAKLVHAKLPRLRSVGKKST